MPQVRLGLNLVAQYFSIVSHSHVFKHLDLEVHDDPVDPVPEEADVGEAPEGDGQPAAAEGAAERDHAVDLTKKPTSDSLHQIMIL